MIRHWQAKREDTLFPMLFEHTEDIFDMVFINEVVSEHDGDGRSP